MSNSEIIEWLKMKAEAVPMPGARKMYQAAIRALEAQKDMVSRQAVLDALNNIEIPRNASWYQYYQQALTAVEKLPPAPTTEVATDNNVGTKVGTNLAEVGTDCISRQAAIDTIEDFPHGDVWNVESMEEMVDRIKLLPSAQPKRETATVSVGKSKGGVTMWYECAACGELVDQGDTFCSGCGRRLIHE